MGNKKPINWGVWSGADEALEPLILRQTIAKLFDSMPAGPVLYISVQYSISFCSPREAVSDVVYGVGAEEADFDVHANLCDSGSNRPRKMRPAHFVMEDDDKRTTNYNIRQKCHSGVLPKSLDNGEASILTKPQTRHNKNQDQSDPTLDLNFTTISQ